MLHSPDPDARSDGRIDELPETVPLGLASLVSAFVRRHWIAYLASAVMLAGIALLTVWVPRRVGGAVDGLVAGQLQGRDFIGELLVLFAMGVAIYALRVGWRLTLYRAAHRLGVALRQRLYRQLTRQGPRFFQRHRTGDLMARATIDIDAVEMAAGEAFLAGFDGTLTLLLVTAMMAVAIDPRLALVALLPFPLMAIGFWWISRRVHDASRASLEAFGTLNDHVQETLAGVRTVRAGGLAVHAREEFGRRTGRAAAHGLDALRWESAYEPVVSWSMSTATILTLAVGGRFVWLGEISLGELTAFTMYLGQLIWPMFAMGWVLSLIERGRAGWERLAPLLREAPDVPDAGHLALPGGPPSIAFEDVTFSFDGQTSPALADLSFSLSAGRTIGVVGPTGAGKSALIGLLMRHHEPQTGRILLGGHPLPGLSLDALRAATAWVPQEAFLFSATLGENIALARPDATAGEIEAVARIADLHDDVTRFAQGYDTPVGERGVTLSGGQRQRVAIARALLADAPLLLLDDALSAVDTATEARILEQLNEVRHGRTTVVVTHRLSAVRPADTILVLDGGRLIEQGTHEALVARGGWYARQWQYQQLEASLETGS